MLHSIFSVKFRQYFARVHIYLTVAANISIDVSNNSDGSSAQQCVFEPNVFDLEETRVYACPCEMYGRYVRIRFPVDVERTLILCEVQVQAGGE